MQNDKEVIDYILTRYTLRRSGVINSNNDDIAKEVNALFGTFHSGESVRAIWRRWNHTLKKEDTSVVRLEKPKYSDFVELNTTGNVLVIPDLHFPFVQPEFISWLKDVSLVYMTDMVICVGDIVDQYALSFFDKSPEAMSAGTELIKTKEMLREFANTFPEMYVTIGNHDNRHLRLAMKAGIPKAYIKDFLEVFDLPANWVWHKSYMLNGKTIIEHGNEGGILATYNRAWSTGYNVVQGHTHAYGGVLYMNDGLKTRWALNVGCGIDEEAYAFHYAAGKRYKSTLGCGVIIDDRPHFVPF